VFSPYYAAAGRRDPREHVALNVALYSPKSSRWAMTERSAAVLRQTRDSLIIGPSRMLWGAEGLTLHVEETAAPIPFAVRGAVRLRPLAMNAQMLQLDAAGKHRWRPIAPLAEIEVEFHKPRLHWRGTAYFDTNEGEESLESGFRRWNWARAHVGGETLVLYDVTRRDKSTQAHALRFDAEGAMSSFTVPKPAKLPNTRWGLKRETRADAAEAASVLKDWEDGPFYSRSLVRTRLLQQDVTAVHESLDLNRFRAFWVHKLLPYRMPRRG
jgi:carotenoid 1,2-hydratase